MAAAAAAAATGYDEAMRVYELISENAEMLPLGKEYDEVSKIFLDDLKVKDVCVSAIFKINNSMLNTLFNMRIEEISIKRGKEPEVIKTYHGTTLEAAASIALLGFDSSYSRIAAYGTGTYCSVNPSTALSYCKDVRNRDKFSMIFMCKFIKGTYGLAKSGSIIDTSKYDYSGCGTNNILVTPYDDGILPEYLICYYSWAEKK